MVLRGWSFLWFVGHLFFLNLPKKSWKSAVRRSKTFCTVAASGRFSCWRTQTSVRSRKGEPEWVTLPNQTNKPKPTKPNEYRAAQIERWMEILWNEQIPKSDGHKNPDRDKRKETKKLWKGMRPTNNPRFEDPWNDWQHFLCTQNKARAGRAGFLEWVFL